MPNITFNRTAKTRMADDLAKPRHQGLVDTDAALMPHQARLEMFRARLAAKTANVERWFREVDDGERCATDVLSGQPYKSVILAGDDPFDLCAMFHCCVVGIGSAGTRLVWRVRPHADIVGGRYRIYWRCVVTKPRGVYGPAQAASG